MAAASSFNFILLLLLLVILFSTTAFFTHHQLTNQVSGDNAVSSIHKVEEGVVDENVNGARIKTRCARKLLMEEKREIKKDKLLVDVNGEISKRRSINHQYHNKKKRNIEDSGFVSLNSDYHPPRHHPPKNN